MDQVAYTQDLIFALTNAEIQAIAANPNLIPATRSEAYDRRLILALSHMAPTRISWTNFFACITQMTITLQLEAVCHTLWNCPDTCNSPEYVKWASSKAIWDLMYKAIIAESENPRPRYEPEYHVHK